MKHYIKLPVVLHFNDYRDIDYFWERLRKIIPGVKRKELEHLGGHNGYVGLFYYKKIDAAAKKLIAENKRLASENEVYY